MIRIEGIFRLSHPLHCAAGSEKVAGQNVTRTMTMPVVSSQGVDDVPYFPGNDLRGRLRRFAAKLLLDHLTANGSKVSRELYSGLMSGSESASPDTAPLSVEEATRGRQHVYMGIFGGGARILRSGYRVSDLLPVIATTIDCGAVPKHFGETTDSSWMPMDRKGQPLRGWQLKHQYNIIRVDDVFRVMDAGAIEKYLVDPATTVGAYQAAISANRTARKEDETGETKKSDVGNMVTFEAIAAGTPMYFRLDLYNHLGDAQLGLIVEALRGLLNQQALGGWVRAGLGQFVADLRLVRDGESESLYSLQDGQYVVTGQAVQAVEAMRLAMPSVTVAELESFYLPRKSEA